MDCLGDIGKLLEGHKQLPSAIFHEGSKTSHFVTNRNHIRLTVFLTVKRALLAQYDPCQMTCLSELLEDKTRRTPQ
jgi:hypothetical protein